MKLGVDKNQRKDIIPLTNLALDEATPIHKNRKLKQITYDMRVIDSKIGADIRSFSPAKSLYMKTNAVQIKSRNVIQNQHILTISKQTLSKYNVCNINIYEFWTHATRGFCGVI